MKTSLKIAVLTFLVIAASSRCYADMMITDVASEQAAKDFGATIRTAMVGTNQVGVWLEFAPKGKLQTFSSVQLEIGSDDQRLVAATLSPLKQTPATVVVYFSTDPTYLSKSTLTVFYKISGGFPPYDGIRFKVSDWIKPPDDPLNVFQGLASPGAKLEDAGGAVAIRTFPLRHRLASQMADDLQQILPGKPGGEVKSSADNQELLVTAPPVVMTRMQTFITVNDWPDVITRGSDFQDRNNSVTRAARSFFYACAIEDSVEVFSKQLSLGVLAELKGDTKSKEFLNYQGGGKPDIDWEKSLRADWPGRKEAIERLIREWNRYPLKRLAEDPGVAIGFGVKHFCSVSFEGAPKPFYQITIEPDRTKQSHDGETSFLFSSLPPWWEGDSVKPSNSKPEKLGNTATPVALDLSYQQFDQTPHSGWRVLAQDEKRFREATALIEAYLLHDGLDNDERVNLHFHAAQCLAFAGDAKSVLDALGHLKQSRNPVESPFPPLRWNNYVDATEAFLKIDLDALKTARERIASGPKLNGTPANLDVVDRLVARFGQPYRQAYLGEPENSGLTIEAPDK